MSRPFKCNEELYKAFIASTVMRYSSCALSEASPKSISHDSVSRWLNSHALKPRLVWQNAKRYINPNSSGILIIDDTLVEKPRTKVERSDIVSYQYSGNHHKVMPGISMVNAVYCQDENFIPVDFRVYHKAEDNKTKNEHLREMLISVVRRGIKVTTVSVDTWYSSLDNLKHMRDLDLGWVAGLHRNRRVNKKTKLEELNVPDSGLKVHLQGYGWIMVYKLVRDNDIRYIGTNMEFATKDEILGYVKGRWSVEVYHRELKQTCGISYCQSNSGRAQRNHIVLCILAWIEQKLRRCLYSISIYQRKWNIVKSVVAQNLREIYVEP